MEEMTSRVDQLNLIFFFRFWLHDTAELEKAILGAGHDILVQ